MFEDIKTEVEADEAARDAKRTETVLAGAMGIGFVCMGLEASGNVEASQLIAEGTSMLVDACTSYRNEVAALRVLCDVQQSVIEALL